MGKSELYKLWDDHVTASIDFQTQRGGGGVSLEKLKERMERTRQAYEKFLRNGRVA